MTKIIQLIESAGDPAAVADSSILYTKDVAGITQAFLRASDGTITQLTPAQAAAPTTETISGVTPVSATKDVTFITSGNFAMALPDSAIDGFAKLIVNNGGVLTSGTVTANGGALVTTWGGNGSVQLVWDATSGDWLKTFVSGGAV